LSQQQQQQQQDEGKLMWFYACAPEGEMS
jgi:hypothetical protein